MNTSLLSNARQSRVNSVENMSAPSFPVSSEDYKRISQSVHLILHILSLEHGCHDNNMAIPSILVGEKKITNLKTQSKWGLELFYLCRVQSGFLEAETKDFFPLKALLYSASRFCPRRTNIKDVNTVGQVKKSQSFHQYVQGATMENVSAIKEGKEETDEEAVLRL